MNILNINQFQIVAFLLVFLRCFAFFMSWPIFSGNSVPGPLKLLFSLTMAMICFSLVPVASYPPVDHYTVLIGLGVKELIIGVAMGFLTNLIFHCVTIAGELISMAMGLSASQVFNPAFGMQQSSINQLYFFLAAFLFLAIRGHHYFIMGLHQSFELISIGHVFPNIQDIGQFALLGQRVLEVGLMLAAPVMVAILLVNFSMGILGRAVPQINVLITSLPVNALMGLVVCGLALPFVLDHLKTEIMNFSEVLFGFLKVF